MPSALSLHHVATPLLIALVGWNLVVFLMMGYDKLLARRGAWRISERTLLTSGAVFGGAGLWLGMRVFHHKTQHGRFRFGAPAMLTLQLALLAWLFLRLPR